MSDNNSLVGMFGHLMGMNVSSMTWHGMGCHGSSVPFPPLLTCIGSNRSLWELVHFPSGKAPAQREQVETCLHTFEED